MLSDGAGVGSRIQRTDRGPVSTALGIDADVAPTDEARSGRVPPYKANGRHPTGHLG